ncbi:MAG: caspase family protein, partial [Hyphomicrobiaceae bacterium]
MTSALKRRHAPSRLFKLMCLVLWSALAAAPVSAERRLALVIGIDAYKNLPRLEKAVNDARSIAAVLQELGFTVTTGEDLSRQDIGQKLADLDTAIQPGDMVFFFFSGHGVALGSDNILIPADMPKPKSGQDGLVRDEGYSVDAIIRRMQGRGAKVTMLVLDACRDNPFAAAGVRNIGVTRGLGRVDAPSGVFVLFSAGLGQTALDRLRDGDPATNSVFTRHLVPLLQTPGLSHVQIAKRVQQEVNALAATISHPQQPAYYDQIVGDIVLRPGAPPLPDVERMRAEERRRVEEMQKQLEEERKKLAAVVRPVPAVPPKVIESAVGVFSDGRTYRPGESFKDCDVCPEMVVVPSGSFVMGSLEDEPNHFATESPQLTVTFTRAFAVGRYA